MAVMGTNGARDGGGIACLDILEEGYEVGEDSEFFGEGGWRGGGGRRCVVHFGRLEKSG